MVAIVVAVSALAVGVALWPTRITWTAHTLASVIRPDGTLFREIQFTAPGGRDVRIRCISGKASELVADVVDVRSTPTGPLRSTLSDPTAALAINGGYFDQHFAPLGLMRVDGQTVTAASSDPLLSACVVGGRNAPVRLVAIDAPVVKTATAARQCGPFLLGPRQIAGNRTKRAERTSVCVNTSRVAFLIATPVSLDDFADILSTGGNTLGIPDITTAVNLDGGPSSGMVDRREDRLVSTEPRGRITDAIVLHYRPMR